MGEQASEAGRRTPIEGANCRYSGVLQKQGSLVGLCIKFWQNFGLNFVLFFFAPFDHVDCVHGPPH
jgi:hypothetical protein